MAIVTNTFTHYSALGIREDLSNIIADISPEQTPFQSNIGSQDVSNTFFEWQTDSLASADDTARISGDDVSSFDATSATSRVGNYTQILRRTMIIEDNLEDVDKAGRASEVAYQLAKKGKELKRDVEKMCLANNARAVGATGTAPETAGLPAWTATNSSRGTGGADPTGDGTDAATDGTQRAFTEAMLKTVMQSAWTAGGEPSMLMVGAFNKTAVSAFSGIAAQRYQAPSDSPTTIIGTADVYMSDFGALNVVANRFQRGRDAFVIDPEYAAIATLRPIQAVDLAKTGDATKKMVLCESGLVVKNEAAHAVIADLTTS
jgi:hypothetical protein